MVRAAVNISAQWRASMVHHDLRNLSIEFDCVNDAQKLAENQRK